MDINFFNDDLNENIVKIQHKDIKLFLIRNLFDNISFNKIQLEITHLIKNSENWENLSNQEMLPRKSLKIDASKLIKDINDNLKHSKLLSYINKIMDENYTSCSFKVWWDTCDYFIPWHCDNDAIAASMQLYVTNVAHNHLGTSFCYIDDKDKNKQINTPFLTLPYIKNSGYLFKNTNQIRHGMTMSVPDGFDRVSLYFYIN
jgi:hypothetical protein